MPSSDFKKDELVTVKGGNVHPVIGGRLRLAHAEGIDGIETEIVEFKPRERAFVHARVFLKGRDKSFDGYGYADKVRDVKGKKDFTDALLELAETRAIARALRFSGFGCEYTGAEEVSHVEGKDKSASVVSGQGNPDGVTDEQSAQLSDLYSKAQGLGVDTDQTPHLLNLRTKGQAREAILWLREQIEAAEALKDPKEAS